MKIDADDLAVFLEEANELFTDFEQCLLLLETLPDDREVINRAFRAAHTIKGGAGMLGLDHLAAFTHELETLLDELRDKQLLCTQAVIDALLASADVIKAHLALISAGRSEKVPDQDLALNRIWKIRAEGDAPPVSSPSRVARGLVLPLAVPQAPSPEALQPSSPVVPAEPAPKLPIAIPPSSSAPTPSSSASFSPIPSPSPSAPPGPAPTAPVPEPSASAPVGPDGHRMDTASASIRVSIEKVDQLVNLVGELSINQAMLGEIVQNFDASRLLLLQESVAQLERHCRDLQQRVLNIRMVPVKGVFDRFHRLVRDVSAQAGKVVALEIRGEETELDKTVVEKIADPLTHLVRNAIDHGLEPTEERRTLGKPQKGTLALAAYQKGANIFIEVRDDGRGLDRARILKKGIALGLIDDKRDPTDDEVWSLIFRPGFSTAEKVTNLSGRGVGMDVVRRNIDELQGKVTIATAPGQGTTFRIQLPLTLAMMDGLLLRVGGDVFLMPLVSVISSFRPTLKQMGRVDSTEVVEVRGLYVPLVRLYEVLSLKKHVAEPTRGIVVVVDDGTKTYGLMVDELVGQLQVVVKSLEANYGRIKGVAGATILGDGQVALILDASSILTVAKERGGHFIGGPGPLVIPAEERS
jgi:two-component system chemotaxis sensor kinase CheA